MKKLLTVADLAEYLSISKSLVYELMDRGEIPFVRVGKSKGYRFDPDDVQAFVQKRKRQNEGARPPAPLPRPHLKHLKN